MEARKNIFQKLLKYTPSSGSLPVAISPAQNNQGIPLDYFISQARASGADVQLIPPPTHSPTSTNKTLYADALLGIAETGSVILRSRDIATSKLFLCEELIITIKQSTIMPFLHEALRSVNSLPSRAIHIITGPSRTADVEQTIQIGAHGPKSVSFKIITAH